MEEKDMPTSKQTNGNGLRRYGVIDSGKASAAESRPNGIL